MTVSGCLSECVEQGSVESLANVCEYSAVECASSAAPRWRISQSLIHSVTLTGLSPVLRKTRGVAPQNNESVDHEMRYQKIKRDDSVANVIPRVE